MSNTVIAFKKAAFNIIELSAVLLIVGAISAFALSNIRSPQDTIEINRFEDYLQRLNASSAHYTKLMGTPPSLFSDFVVENASEIDKEQGLYLNLLHDGGNQILCRSSSLGSENLECNLNTTKKIATYELQNGIVTVVIEDK